MKYQMLEIVISYLPVTKGTPDAVVAALVSVIRLEVAAGLVNWAFVDGIAGVGFAASIHFYLESKLQWLSYLQYDVQAILEDVGQSYWPLKLRYYVVWWISKHDIYLPLEAATINKHVGQVYINFNLGG